MEEIWNDFDEESKLVVEELTQDSKKLRELINKLQTAKLNMDAKAKSKETQLEEAKK